VQPHERAIAPDSSVSAYTYRASDQVQAVLAKHPALAAIDAIKPKAVRPGEAASTPTTRAPELCDC